MMNSELTVAYNKMPLSSKEKNLKLDLNLMNLNVTNSSKQLTPNGKIKVFMNKIANNITKVKNSDNEWRRCKLDEENCISLNSVLNTFNSAINQEQAWAICYGFTICVKNLIEKGYKLINKPLQNLNNNINYDDIEIYLHKNGFIDEKTIINSLNESKELNEQELLMKLGLVIFDALDYKNDSNEELTLSYELENLIDKMTLEESEDNIGFTIDQVYEICYSRKDNSLEKTVDEYYKSICKTLVIETIELSTFLQKIYEGTQIRDKLFCNTKSSEVIDLTDSKIKNEEPLKLHLAQWAKLWMQVLEEFRNGKRKLKKVETKINNTNLKESQLNKINAHALIMEYIKSRPALMPAKDRKLGLCLKPSPQSLIEKIHEEIKNQNIKLRPVITNARNSIFASKVGRVVDNKDLSISTSVDNSPINKRKLIKADIDWDFYLDDDFCGKKYSSLF